MEISKKREIAKRLKVYLEEHSMPQAIFAERSGVDKAHISRILREDSDFMYDAGRSKKRNIPNKHFYKIAEAIGFSIEKSYWNIVQTDESKAMLSYLFDAREYGFTNVIIGETGIGKTYLKNLFMRKYPVDVFSVTVGKSDTIGDLIDKTLDALNINTNAKSKSKKIKEIIKKLDNLREDGYKPTLIFDEIEFMSAAALCSLVKSLYDYLHEKAAILLIGTQHFIDNIEVLRKRNRAGIPQLWRRLKFCVLRLPKMDKSFSLFLEDIEDKKLIRFLQTHCENYGELHDILVPARREADRMKKEMTLNHVRAVCNLSESEYK